MQLVIIAGGKGTRLKERLGDKPKPMAPLDGKPLLEHLVLLGRKHGCDRVLLLTGYGAEQIASFCGDGAEWNVRIEYHTETKPLGTAGAVLSAFDKLEERFLVMYGDTMMNVDLKRLASSHPEDAAATLFLHPNDHPQDSDLVEIDEQSRRVLRFHPYPHPPGEFLANLVNAALYVISKSALRPYLPLLEHLAAPLDFGKHLFPALLKDGASIHAYVSREYIKDAGTPARLDRVEADLRSGRIAKGSFETALPAVFLDRDGTLNHERGFLTSADDLELLPGAAQAVHAINRAGWLAVLVTNQPVIARGDCTEAELRRIHDKLEWLLGEAHAYLDAIYFCPHHPDKGFPNERAELKFACRCRKPETGMLLRAVEELNIDVPRSWMIGDRPGDVQAANKLGIRSALVQTGFGKHARTACEPTQVFRDVLDATTHILVEALRSE